MRYPASEKLEIIRLVEESHLSARLTLAKLGIPRTTFYRWYDRYRPKLLVEVAQPKMMKVVARET
jgi:putative transposase